MHNRSATSADAENGNWPIAVATQTALMRGAEDSASLGLGRTDSDACRTRRSAEPPERQSWRKCGGSGHTKYVGTVGLPVQWTATHHWHCADDCGDGHCKPKRTDCSGVESDAAVRHPVWSTEKYSFVE